MQMVDDMEFSQELVYEGDVDVNATVHEEFKVSKQCTEGINTIQYLYLLCWRSRLMKSQIPLDHFA